MRGMRGRVGGELTQIQLICDYWGNSFSADHAPHAVGKVYGSKSGTIYHQCCPAYQFMVGYDVWSGSSVNGLQIVCADMR